MFDSESRSLRQQVERDAKTVADFETRLQEKRKREIELKNELAQVRLPSSFFFVESVLSRCLSRQTTNAAP